MQRRLLLTNLLFVPALIPSVHLMRLSVRSRRLLRAHLTYQLTFSTGGPIYLTVSSHDLREDWDVIAQDIAYRNRIGRFGPVRHVTRADGMNEEVYEVEVIPCLTCDR